MQDISVGKAVASASSSSFALDCVGGVGPGLVVVVVVSEVRFERSSDSSASADASRGSFPGGGGPRRTIFGDFAFCVVVVVVVVVVKV